MQKMRKNFKEKMRRKQDFLMKNKGRRQYFKRLLIES